MKKEFKAPIVETKVLSTRNSIMDIGESGNMGTKSAILLKDDEKTNAEFKQWKGFGNK